MRSIDVLQVTRLDANLTKDVMATRLSSSIRLSATRPKLYQSLTKPSPLLSYPSSLILPPSSLILLQLGS
jgi:hypothetical protein